MTRDELLEYHEEVCKDAKNLMSLKNRDYAGNDGKEPFANFTRVESMGICSTEQGFLTRITDKMRTMIARFQKNYCLSDELSIS